MPLDTDRRAITFFLLILLAVVALKTGDVRTITLTLAPTTALLARMVAFYFPCGRRHARSAGDHRRDRPGGPTN